MEKRSIMYTLSIVSRHLYNSLGSYGRGMCFLYGPNSSGTKTRKKDVIFFFTLASVHNFIIVIITKTMTVAITLSARWENAAVDQGISNPVMRSIPIRHRGAAHFTRKIWRKHYRCHKSSLFYMTLSALHNRIL